MSHKRKGNDLCQWGGSIRIRTEWQNIAHVRACPVHMLGTGVGGHCVSLLWAQMECWPIIPGDERETARRHSEKGGSQAQKDAHLFH